jgi:carbon-monoxide dehydrogenase large subunit
MGQPVRRLEDRRFLTGRGRYVDDLSLPGTAQAVYVRSDRPHARILSLNIAEAALQPGVLAILTGADWQAAGLGHYVVWSPVKSSDGVERPVLTQPILALDEVAYVGQPIALVVAETREQALDAVERVEIRYEDLPFVTETANSLAPGAPLAHSGLESNLAFTVDVGDRAAVEKAFARAAHTTELVLTNNRITANPLEPRAILAAYDEATDHYTIWVTHQAPHLLRRDLAENTLLHPEHKIRVIAPDVGGGFGMKVANHPEEPALLFASRVVGRPVRWTSTRSEGLISDAQARDHATTCRMAFDSDGRILALWADTIASLGAYQTRMGASIPAQFYSRALVGLYTTPNLFCRVRGVYTNAPPVQAYRGAGRPEAVYVVESLLENGAREMGIDVREIRSRNFIRTEDYPYRTPLDIVYDSGNPQGLLEKALGLFDYESLRREQKRRRDAGRELLGIGLAGLADCLGTPSKAMAAFGRKVVGGWDSAHVRIHPNGQVTVLAGSHSHGQGHATTFAQIVASRLHCPIDSVEVVEGDTDKVQYGHGTWGSRSTVTTGIAVAKAAELLALKCRRIAAHLLESEADAVAFSDGVFRAVGTNRSVPARDVHRAAYQGGNLPPNLEPGLEQLAFHDPAERVCSSGLHICAVLVDPETGQVRIRKYVAIDDCGTVINPMIVEGQAQGGIAQGIGQALMEDCTFDHSTGQPLAGSFMDYAMPRASDFPDFDTGVQESPSPHNPLGVKGAGESGTIGALAAVRNAVVDALWPLGVRHVDMPMTPARVWQAIEAAAKDRVGVGRHVAQELQA